MDMVIQIYSIGLYVDSDYLERFFFVLFFFCF